MPVSLKSSQSFTNFLTGSAATTVATVLANLFGFIVSIIVARTYGASTVGSLAAISSFVTLLSTLAICGTDTLALKIVSPASTRDSVFALHRKFFVIAALLTTIAAAVMFMARSLGYLSAYSGFTGYFAFAFLLVFVSSIHRIQVNIIRAIGDIFFYASMPLSQAFLQLLCVFTAVYLSLNNSTLVYFFFLPYIMVAIYSLSVLVRIAGRVKNTPPDLDQISYPAILRSALPMVGSTIGFTLITTVDILMLTTFTTAEDVGVYAIYSRLLLAVNIVMTSVNAMLAPTIAQLYKADKQTELANYVKKTTLVTFLATMAISLFILLFHQPILALFGKEFLQDPTPLYLLLTIPIVNSFFGATGYFMNMTGKEKVFLAIMAVAALLNILLNWWLIPTYGLIGAAIASLVTVVLWNSVATWVIGRSVGYTLFFLRTNKLGRR